MDEFYQTFREYLLPSLIRLSQNIENTETLANTIYKANITLILKVGREKKISEISENYTNTQSRENKISGKVNFRPLFLMNINAEILNKI